MIRYGSPLYMSLFSSKPKPSPLEFLAEYSEEKLVAAMASVESVFANIKIAYNGHKELFDRLFAAAKTVWTGIAFSVMTADESDRERIVQDLAKKHPQIERIANIWKQHFGGSDNGG